VQFSESEVEMARFDVAIVGGGIMGSATAYYLRKQGFKGSIGVFEKDPTYKQSCTALSWGGIRRQFSTPENIHLSAFGLRLLANLKTEFGADADIGFKEQGYLVMASEAGRSVLEENASLQVSMGADTQLLEGEALAARFPHMSFDGIALASFGRTGEGWFDPYQLLSLFRKAAVAHDVSYVAQGVEAIEMGQLQLRTADGATHGFGELVNAAGTGAGQVAAMIGFDLPVSPAKRYVYVVDCPDAPESLRKGPLTFDINGIYFRPEGRNFIWGYTPKEDEEPVVKDWEMDYSWFEDVIWPQAAARVPAFETVKMIGSWVGHYDYNWFDQNGIIGRHPDVKGLYLANGFSGHGIQQGPAVGNAIAELICHGEYRTIDLTRMGVDRLARNEPLFERNIF
jgi:FAD-dependent oxidoreductase domain-containing protein 1